MSFMLLDLIFLVLFISFTSIFLYKNKTKLTKQGWMFLYHTQWGVNLIHKTGEKYKKTLKFLSYISVTLGYMLMAGMLWLFARILWIYIFNQDAVRAIKIPPIMPLIPYLPQIFKLTFLPPFYFTYWIIILAVIAITHEFFHGIFAKISNIKTKTTGFGFFPFFLPIFLAAFVELDEKIMQKKSSFKQRAVLSAGTFANLLTAVAGILILWGFFTIAFSPAGIVFDDYAYGIVNTSDINYVNGIQLNNPTYDQVMSGINESSLNDIRTQNENFSNLRGTSSDGSIIAAYYSAPAIKAGIYGPITKVNNEPISNLETFSKELGTHSPGEEITIGTLVNREEIEYKVILEENPISEGEAWLGVSFSKISNSKGVVSRIAATTTFYKEPHAYYIPNHEWQQFVYDLIWWLIIISFSVALINMLPMGIFDGGRFFYLTVLSLTKSKSKAEKAFKGITKFFLLLLLIIMAAWLFSFF
jgi:membrane-associated protease RseP (regulator of RpoE activity)